MYDLEIINLSENTNETETVKTLSTSTSENAHLLTNEELAESFERIRRDMIEPKQNLPQETITDTSKTLQLQKQRLSSVMKEAEALSKANNTPDLEIQSETIKELRQEKKHQKAVAYKQAEKNKKKQEKKEIADRKKLVKLQPKGTIMSIDKNKGIDFEGAEIIEVKTLTTSEEKKEN